MPHVHIPFELLDHIFAFVSEEDTLASQDLSHTTERTVLLDLPRCRLVCRSWDAFALRHVFSCMVVSPKGGKTFERCVDFLKASPNVASKVKALTLRACVPSAMEAILHAETLQNIVQNLPSLRALELHAIKLISWPDHIRASFQDIDDQQRRSVFSRVYMPHSCSSLINMARLKVQSFMKTNRRLPEPSCPSTTSHALEGLVDLKVLSFRSFRVRELYMDQLISLTEIFHSIGVLNLHGVGVTGSHNSDSLRTDDQYVRRGRRVNNLLVKELRVKDVASAYLTAFLEKAIAVEALQKLHLDLELSSDAPVLVRWLELAVAPGTHITSLHIELNGSAGHMWSFTLGSYGALLYGHEFQLHPISCFSS